MKNKSQSAESLCSGVRTVGQGRTLAWVGPLDFLSLPLPVSPHRRIAEIASGANGASKEAGAGIPESQR